MRHHVRTGLAILLLFIATGTIADESHPHNHGPVDLGRLGSVTFKTSCKADVQEEFARAVAMMHSFWYAEAEKAFRKVAASDPKCAMAQWGVAMSNYHPIWAPPTPDELRRGREAAVKARSMKAPTPRERAYIEAIHAFYESADTRDHATRAAAYSQRMESLATAHADDDEAQIFHALALLGTASLSDKTYAVQKRAAEILGRVLPNQPEHPGVAHYIIHSYDYPLLAAMALPAARAYAKIAPGSPHALHMPSHIFTRLGLWDESISSNVASADKARSYIQQIKAGTVAFDELHAIDYLVYAYIQQGEDAKAKALVDRLLATDAATLDSAVFQAAYAFSAVPARYALERRQWDAAAQLVPAPANFAWKNFPYAEANVHFARAIGAARSGDLNAAKAAVDRLDAIRRQLVEQKNAFWAEHVGIQHTCASAWLAHAAGFTDEGLRRMRAAADLEDKTEKHPVTPGAVLPARELLADMLLESGRAADAVTEAELALAQAPNRFNGTWLAARAAEASGDVQRAETHYRKLAEIARNGVRPELEKARTFVARK